MVKKPWIGFSLAAIPVVFIIIFVGFPIILAVLYTFGYTHGPNEVVSQMAQNQFVASWLRPNAGVYAQLWASPSFRADLWATVWVTLLSVLALLLVSWILALYLRFSNSRLARVVSTLYLVPMFIPGVIASYALVSFYNDGGFVSTVAAHLGGQSLPSLGYTLPGVVIGNVWTGLPFATLLIASGLRSVPDALVEAARDSGAHMGIILVRILFPINALPTIIVLTFSAIGVLGSFTIPYLMGPSAPLMLGVAMSDYYSLFNEPQQAEAMAVLIFLLATVFGALYVWANVRMDRRSGVSS